MAVQRLTTSYIHRTRLVGNVEIGYGAVSEGKKWGDSERILLGPDISE